MSSVPHCIQSSASLTRRMDSGHGQTLLRSEGCNNFSSHLLRTGIGIGNDQSSAMTSDLSSDECMVGTRHRARVRSPLGDASFPVRSRAAGRSVGAVRWTGWWRRGLGGPRPRSRLPCAARHCRTGPGISLTISPEAVMAAAARRRHGVFHAPAPSHPSDPRAPSAGHTGSFMVQAHGSASTSLL